MFKKTGLENMFKPKSAAGLEVILMPDGSYQLHLVLLKKQQSTLVTVLQKKDILSIAEIKQLIDPKVPLNVIINGKGIIHRKVHSNENDSANTLLNKLLPNANPEDFVIQKTPVNTEEAIVSVIRVNSLNELLQQFIDHQLTNISACFIGPFVVNNLLPLLDPALFDNEHLHINNFKLQVKEQQIHNIEVSSTPLPDQIRIGNDLLPCQLLIPFAAALTGFTGETQDIVSSGLLNRLKEEFQQKQKFELRSWSFLITIFLILIINYFVFNNYWSKNREMTAQLELTQAASQRYAKLRSDFDQKEGFLKENGLLESSRTSYFADQLAKELPSSLQLTGLNIHPLKKKKAGEEDHGFSFENKTILVSGNCQRNTELNEWMKKIKKLNWVNDVSLLNYKQENAGEAGIFLIGITIK